MTPVCVRDEGERACDSPRCFCSWPPVRRIWSTGQSYTVQALPYVGEPWLFRYVYLEVAA